jgi:hypothetical protein
VAAHTPQVMARSVLMCLLYIGVIYGTCGVIQGTCGVIQGTFGVIQGTCGVIQGTFGVNQGTFVPPQYSLGMWWLETATTTQPFMNPVQTSWRKQISDELQGRRHLLLPDWGASMYLI